jgi:hypothetical protein
VAASSEIAVDDAADKIGNNGLTAHTGLLSLERGE